MLTLLLVAQLSVLSIDLSVLPAPAVSIEPVEVDANPDTAHWLIYTTEGLYYLGETTRTACLSRPFYPVGNRPIDPLSGPPIPVYRVGRLDAFVSYRADLARLFVYRLPTGCTDPTVWPR